MTKRAILEQAITKAESDLKAAKAALDDHLSRTITVKCNNSVLGKGCGKKTTIGKLIFIQTHWWSDRCNCYFDSEGNAICPKCGNRIRLLWENEHVVEHRRRFKRRVNEYKND